MGCDQQSQPPCGAPRVAGTLQRLEREREDEATRAMRELQRVSGIGVQRAKELMEGGVTSLEALRQDEAAKAKLSRGELIGLKHVYDLEHRIPRAELAQLEALVLRAARAHEPPLEAVVCGSYRRGAAASGDIDVLLTHPSYQQRPRKNQCGWPHLRVTDPGSDLCGNDKNQAH